MPKASSVVRSRAKERESLQQKIEVDADSDMPACSCCSKAGAVCFIAPKLNRACARCVRMGRVNDCDAFMNEDECECFSLLWLCSWLICFAAGNKLSQKLRRLRDERRELKRRLREIQDELGRVHDRRQEMFARSLENLDVWETAEVLPDLPARGPVLVPGDDGVMWDFTTGSGDSLRELLNGTGEGVVSSLSNS